MGVAEAVVRNGTERWFAEAGKEGVLLDLIDRAGTPTRYFVEIGVQDGVQCNTRYLRQHRGWTGVMLDQMTHNREIGLHQRFVTAENINRILVELNVPSAFDLLSIDVDGNDFWIWHSLHPQYRPRIVVIECKFGDAYVGIDA